MFKILWRTNVYIFVFINSHCCCCCCCFCWSRVVIIITVYIYFLLSNERKESVFFRLLQRRKKTWKLFITAKWKFLVVTWAATICWQLLIANMYFILIIFQIFSIAFVWQKNKQWLKRFENYLHLFCAIPNDILSLNMSLTLIKPTSLVVSYGSFFLYP